MNEMLGYVFGSLENNRRDILNLKKCMNNQIKINKLKRASRVPYIWILEAF